MGRSSSHICSLSLRRNLSGEKGRRNGAREIPPSILYLLLPALFQPFWKLKAGSDPGHREGLKPREATRQLLPTTKGAEQPRPLIHTSVTA